MYHEYKGKRIDCATQRHGATRLVIIHECAYELPYKELVELIGKEQTYQFAKSLPWYVTSNESAYAAELKKKIAEVKGQVVGHE